MKHWCRDSKFDCSVLFSRYCMIMSKQSGHLFLTLPKYFGRTFLVQRRSIFAGDMVMWSSEKVTSALVIVSVLTGFPVLSPMSSVRFSWVLPTFPLRICFFHSQSSPMNEFHRQMRNWSWSPVTGMMVTDCYLQSWTDLRVPTDPSFRFGLCVVSRFDMSHSICQFPHSPVGA